MAEARNPPNKLFHYIFFEQIRRIRTKQNSAKVKLKLQKMKGFKSWSKIERKRKRDDKNKLGKSRKEIWLKQSKLKNFIKRILAVGFIFSP